MTPGIYLAPMEGITTYIFRNAISKYYGSIDRYYTPFLTASHLKGRELRDVTPENNEGLSVVPQILTNDSGLFLEISRQLHDIGYNEVNLNLGCPSGTVVAKGRGAGFLDKVDKLDIFLYEIFDGIQDVAPDMSISIKTRLGMEYLSEWEDILEVYIKYPIKELIIHPRLRNEYYQGEVHIDSYITAKEYIGDRLDICYNGDIVDIPTYDDILCKLEPNNVMIGRGLIMNPGLARDIRARGETSERAPGLCYDRVFKDFINEIMERYIDEMNGEKQVVMKMKELWTYLAKGLGLGSRELKEIYKTNRLAEYKNAIQMIFSSQSTI